MMKMNDLTNSLDNNSQSSSLFRLWSEENLPPKEFVRKYRLPQVACIHEGGGKNGTEGSPTSMVDLEQPFLLFKSYSSIKVHARSLQPDLRRPGAQIEVGPTVAIPEDYTVCMPLARDDPGKEWLATMPARLGICLGRLGNFANVKATYSGQPMVGPGWFAIVADNSGRSGPQTARHYTSVEQVAKAQVPFFLVRNDTPAYKLHDLRTSGGKLVYTKTTVRTGHVLKLLGVFEDINTRHQSVRQKSQMSSDLGCGSSRTPDGKESIPTTNTFKYAQCLNYKGEVVFLPFTAQGMFYATGTKGGTTRNLDHVYLMSHLLKFSKFPVTVRLVCGFLPKVPCNFTGLLRLTCAKREEIILACTLLKERNVMLEMDMNSGFTLRKALNEERYTKFESYQSAIDFCGDEAEIWRRQMKVMHFVFPESTLTRAGHSTYKQTSLPTSVHQNLQAIEISGSGSRKSLTAPSTNQKSFVDQVETQSVCISMIFDDHDQDNDELNERTPVERSSSSLSSSSSLKKIKKRSIKLPNHNAGDIGIGGKDVIKDELPITDKQRKTKFWTLRRFKRLMNVSTTPDNGDSQCGVMRGGLRRTINDWVNDGSENANDEFMTRLPNDVGRSYVKLPGFQIPENGTYVKSPPLQCTKSITSTPNHPMLDAIT